MAIKDNKILSWTNPIVNEADRPQRTASEMKAVFDSNSNQLRQALNGLIDDLSQNGAAELPAAPLDGVDGVNVEEQLAGLKKYADERESEANRYTDEREVAANQYADEREEAANQYTDEREVEIRKYADEREAAAKRYAESLAFESGSADMQRSVYDPQGKAQDVFAYADNAANSLRNELDEKAEASDVAASVDALNTAIAAKENKSTTTTATLIASAWTADGEEYAQTVEVEGMTGIKNIVVGPAPECHIAYNAAGAYCYAQDVGALTFKAIEIPEVDLIANILAVGG